MTPMTVLTILLAGIFSNNYALLHFLGTGAVIENERTNRRSLLLGLGVTVVMVLSTLISWPINKFLLANFPYFQTMAFVIVILAVVEVVHVIIKNSVEVFCRVDFIKFAINGAVLGLCIHNTELTILEAVITAAAVGIGFTLVMTIFGALRNKIDEEAVPASFRGLPISLLCAGMIALALLSFTFSF